MKLRPVKVGTLQVGAHQIDPLEREEAEVGAAKVRLAQVESVWLLLSLGNAAPTEHGQDRANVRACTRQGRAATYRPRGESVGFRRLGLRTAGRRGPPGVLAYVRGEHFHDRPVVSWRVTADALQRVDAAQAHLQVRLAILELRTKLGDGLGNAIGDLDLAVDVQLLLGSARRPLRDLPIDVELLLCRRQVSLRHLPVLEREQADD